MLKRKSEFTAPEAKSQCLDHYEILISVIETILDNSELLQTRALLSMTTKKLRGIIALLSFLTVKQQKILRRLNAMKPRVDVFERVDIHPDYVIESNTGEGKTLIMLIFAAQQRLKGKRVLILGPNSMRTEYTTRINALKTKGIIPPITDYAGDYFEFLPLNHRDPFIPKKDVVLVDDRKTAKYPPAVAALRRSNNEVIPLIVYFRSGGYSKESVIGERDVQLTKPPFSVHFAYTSSCIYCDIHEPAKVCWSKNASIASPDASPTLVFLNECYQKHKKLAIFISAAVVPGRFVELLAAWCRKGRRIYQSVISSSHASEKVDEFNSRPEGILLIKNETYVTGLNILANCIVILENLPQNGSELDATKFPDFPYARDLDDHLNGTSWIVGLVKNKFLNTAALHQIIGRALRPEKVSPVEVYMISNSMHRIGLLADAYTHSATFTKQKTIAYFSKLNLLAELTKSTVAWRTRDPFFIGYKEAMCKRFRNIDYDVGTVIRGAHESVKFTQTNNHYFEEFFTLGLK